MSFEKQNTIDRTVAIICQELDVDKENVTITTSFDDLGADSLDMVQIVMSIEEDFGMEVIDDDLSDFQTLSDVVDYIHTRRTK